MGSASLSWWGPTVLSDIELDAPDGKPFFRVRRVTEDCSVWGSMFRRTDPLHAVFEDPVVTIVLHPQGSNVEDALAPVLAHPGHEIRQRTTKVAGGRFQITDSVTGENSSLQNVSVETMTDASDGSANRVVFRADEDDSPSGGHIEAGLSWPSRSTPNPQDAGGIKDVNVHVTNVSLERLQVLAHRLWSGVRFSGLVSGHLSVKMGSDSAGTTPSPVSGDWELNCRDLQIISINDLGIDNISPGPIEFRGRFARAGATCRIDDLHFKTDFSHLEGGLWLPNLENASPHPGAQVGPVEQALPELSCRGELDIPALARLAAGALHLREGIDLKEGRIQLDVASRIERDSPRWTGQLATSRIAAVLDGEEIAWDQPLNVQFAARRNLGHYEIERIESQSDVFMLHGGATENRIHLEAGCDLHELQSRLGKFLNTDGFEARGTLTAAADFTRDVNDALRFDTRTNLENLILRRQVTRMVERRAGEVQAEPAPPPTLPARPSQPTDPPRNKKEMAAQRRAERRARQETRREEREAHRQANQIVLVPIPEWQTLWTEPRFNLTCRGRVEFSRRLVDDVRLEIVSDGIQLLGKGRVSEIPKRCVVDLTGDIEYDTSRLIERARQLVGPFIQVTGHDTRRFSITGPLREQSSAPIEERPLVPPELAATAGAGWKGANVFGLPAGPAEVDLTLAQGVVAPRPVEIELGGGKVRLRPRVLLTGRPALLVIPEGRMISGVELTDQFCDGWLKFIAPILSQATRCSGRFSLDLDESQLPLINPAAGNLTGRLQIDRGEVLPGPLFDEINGLIGRIISGVGVDAPQDLLGLDRPLVQFKRQEVEFELHEGRVHHEAVESQARGIVIRTRGSVGLDQTLDLVAAISLSDDVLSRARLLGPLKGQTLEIPISGTLRRPRLDRRAIGRLAEQLGQSTLDTLLNQGLQKLFERND